MEDIYQSFQLILNFYILEEIHKANECSILFYNEDHHDYEWEEMIY